MTNPPDGMHPAPMLATTVVRQTTTWSAIVRLAPIAWAMKRTTAA